MKLNREDAGEMYSPDDQGEYVLKVGMQNFSVQGLLDALTSLEFEGPAPSRRICSAAGSHYGGSTWESVPACILLECWHGPSHPEGRSHTLGSGACAGGQPRHCLSSFMTSRAAEDLSRMSPRTSKPMWQSRSANFVVILLPLAEGWCRAMAASDRWHQRSWVEHPDCPVPHMMSSKSDSMPPLVGSALPSTAWMAQLEEGGSHSLRVPSSWPREGPLNNAQPRMVRGIHCHPPWIEMVWTQMGTPR